jgi:acylphosphatase
MSQTRDKDDRKALRLRVTGRVQGVSFRFWTREQAERVGVSGWVRNEPDGSVEAMIAGPEAAVDEMARLLGEGPPAASVSNVEAIEEDPDMAGEGFRITG